ncbi:McrB family protein [Halanaerobaculum tunisiense]
MSSKKNRKIKDSYMLGILATEEDTYPRLGINQEPVTFMMTSKGDNVLFYVRRISSDPQTYLQHNVDDRLFIGFSQSFKKLDDDVTNKLNYPQISTSEKERIVREKLEDKIILFEPLFKYENEERKHKNLNILDLKDIDDIEWINDIKELEKTEFKPIPTLDLDKKEFGEKLFNGEKVEFSNYNCNEMLEPDIVLVDDILYTNLELGWAKSKDANYNILEYKNEDTIGILRLPDNFQQNCIYEYQNLLFISDEYYRELNEKSKEFNRERFNQEMINNIEKIDDDNANSIKNNNQNIRENKKEMESNKKSEEFKKNMIEEKEINMDSVKNNKNIENSQNEIKYNERENQFLKRLYNNALRKKLYYDKEDLYNLHTSIKTSPLTIISGMSGTGKTRMAQLYAETLGLKSEYIILDIRPSYTEPSDVLGYLNTINGIYTPAETGLVDILIEASKNPNKIYMVIFDEMNLSQVEHWFSPFISLLELDEENRKLPLYGENNICHNKRYPSSISIGDNVVFIGTVNVDETTKDFSDRLLDRVNVVTPKKLEFCEIKDKINNNQFAESDDKVRTYKGGSIFNEWRKKVEDPIEFLKREELELLDKLHHEINKVDAQKGVSFRIIKNIAIYLKNIPLKKNGEPFISRSDAFDIQLKQRLLTKLTGHQEQYGNLIGEFKNDEIFNSKIYEILTSELGQQISDFNRSIKELKRKAKEMHFNGYAL